MSYADELRAMIADYLLQVEKLLAEAQPADGLLGMGKAPQHAPCHEEFDRRVEALFVAAAEDVLSAGEAAELAAVLLFAEDAGFLPDCARWMLIAAHRHCQKITRFLYPEAAADLYARYSKLYPVYRRLPIQKELLKALRCQ